MKQDESNGDLEFTATIGFGGKLSNLKGQRTTIMKMEGNMHKSQKPHIGI
jgi:hypothetical protein